MRNKICIIVFSMILTACYSGKKMNQLKFDKKAESKILYGYTNIQGFQKEPFSQWYNFEYENYNPDIVIIDEFIKGEVNLPDKITIVMGTWCPDSQREVPRFIKILGSIKFSLDSLTIINVDTKKQAEKTDAVNLNIIKIPTFIFYKNGIESGRIIESPQESLEKDLLKIMAK